MVFIGFRYVQLSSLYKTRPQIEGSASSSLGFVGARFFPLTQWLNAHTQALHYTAAAALAVVVAVAAVVQYT